MKEKMLQTVDKLLFVKQLYDYCSRATNSKVRSQYAEQLNVSERSFSDKMCTHRSFKGQELDTVEKLYKSELGQVEFEKQFTLFISRRSDGDIRTIENAQDRDIKELSEFNDQLAVSKLLV